MRSENHNTHTSALERMMEEIFSLAEEQAEALEAATVPGIIANECNSRRCRIQDLVVQITPPN